MYKFEKLPKLWLVPKSELVASLLFILMSVLKLLPILDIEKGDEDELEVPSILFISMSVLKGNVVDVLPNILFMLMLLENVSKVFPKIGVFFAPIDAIPEFNREPVKSPNCFQVYSMGHLDHHQ